MIEDMQMIEMEEYLMIEDMQMIEMEEYLMIEDMADDRNGRIPDDTI